MFAGFVTDWADTVDQDNQKLVTLTCEDVLRPFRYARITTNPGIFDVRVVKQVEDLAIRTFFNAGFANLTLTELLYTIVFGPTNAKTADKITQAGAAGVATDLPPFTPYRRVGVRGPNTTSIPTQGVGAFVQDRSVVAIFGPEAKEPADESAVDANEVRISSLAGYQALIDHKVTETDLDSMVDPLGESFRGAILDQIEGARVDGRIPAEDIITFIGTRPESYPVDGGRLIMLVPGNLGVDTNRNIITKDLISSIATQTTFRSRLAMIYDVLKEIEFSFYATPKGDLVCEFPLYDFEPYDWGRDPVVAGSNDAAAVATIDSLRAATGLPALQDTGDTFGPYEIHYKVSKEDTIQWTRTFTDEKIRTQFLTTKQLVQAFNIGTAVQVGLPPKVETLRALVPQFGLRIETTPPTTFIASDRAANVYNQIKLNQWNADARSASVDVVMRLGAGPNRPLLFSERNYIATVRSVSRTIDWNNDVSMNLGVNYIRGWDGSRRSDDPGRLLYSPIGGFASRPLNYKVLFEKEAVEESSKSGPSAEEGEGAPS
jgi:hypothetical protein